MKPATETCALYTMALLRILIRYYSVTVANENEIPFVPFLIVFMVAFSKTSIPYVQISVVL